MKLALLTSWMSVRGGGVFDVVRRTALGLRVPAELEVSVFGLAEPGKMSGCVNWGGVPAVMLPTAGPQAIGYAPRLVRELVKGGFDLLHVHGLWMYPSVASLTWSHATRRPYMITPHGMLDRWALDNSRWKKRLALWAFERRHLRGAACIHALCEAEADSIRAFGLRNPICIIPNSVSLSGLSTDPTLTASRRSSRTVLFLGRLHPKKGLPNLLTAWSQFERRRGVAGGEWQLAVVGWDQGRHEHYVRNLASQLGVTESVHFHGPLFDADKHAAFRSAAAFVLPSVSEGVPMVVLEAWSHGLPVLMTRQCNIPEGYAAGAAVEITPESDGILQGLRALAAMTESDRREMGRRGLQLIAERFTTDRVTEALRDVYRWLVHAGPRPAGVLSD
jgi:glycosyltransferase involved in cell wall biosynthesis